MEVKKFARAKVTYISNPGITTTVEATDVDAGAVEVEFRVEDAVYKVHRNNVLGIEEVD